MKAVLVKLYIGCVALMLASDCGPLSAPKRGETIYEQWQTSNNVFTVRVLAYPEENGGFVPGAYYVFQSSSSKTPGQWNEITTFRHDDLIPIPRNQVQFLNDRVGYLFMAWMYAVTVDGGATWSIWSAEKDLPNWRCCNYRLIQDVHIAPDGAGRMRLNPIPQRQGEVPELHTEDYGQHWSVK